MYNIQVLEIIMTTILRLLSLIMFIVSAILFSLMTWDMLDYGRYSWGYLQFLIWLALGIATYAYGLATASLILKR